MANEPIAVTPDLTLADLETTVGQLEQQLGALLSIANDGTNSLFTFDEEHEPEEDQLVALRTVPIDRIAAPAGLDMVCEGDAFVGGELVHIAAFRAVTGGVTPPASPPPAPVGSGTLTQALRIA